MAIVLRLPFIIIIIIIIIIITVVVVVVVVVIIVVVIVCAFFYSEKGSSNQMHGVQNESPHQLLTPTGTGEMVCLLVAGCESWRAGIPVIVLTVRCSQNTSISCSIELKHMIFHVFVNGLCRATSPPRRPISA